MPERVSEPVADGWWRDDEGRVFQVEFDMNRRAWLGARWLGTFRERGEPSRDLEGVGLDLGFRVDVSSDEARTMTRFRFLEGELTLAPLTMRARLLAIDTSNDGDRPFMRVTTFVGEPTRHDIFLTAGWWGELLAIEHAPRGAERDTIVRYAGAGVTWDFWHDAIMASFIRLRAGVGVDAIVHDGDDGRIALTPIVALEADVVFDCAGFHRLVVSSIYEAPFFEDAAGDGGERLEHRTRWSNELAYELILIAVDDQPVTLRVGVQGGWRDDLSGQSDGADHGWDLAVTAGLRLSLWAPTPDYGARADAEQRRRGRKP